VPQALPEEEAKAEDAKAPVAESKDAGATTEVVKH
jgi:ATP-dependent Lon protease